MDRRGARRGSPAVKAAGLTDVTPHDLRASHATWVAERHGIMAAAARLGHAHASVTSRHYARAAQGQDRTVADDLDRARAERGEDPCKGPQTGS
jgi:integrase